MRATLAYERWLMATPMERLNVVPDVPQAFENGPWARVERRGSLALLKAMPEGIRAELVATRAMGSIAILFAVFKIYQPGGLGEKTALLRHLVDVKAPSGVGEWITALRNWRRWLVRLGELNIQAPDPVLLVASLDRFAVVMAKMSTEVAFRLQVARAALQVDVVPTMQGVERFTQALLAEGETMFHAQAKGTNGNVKVKALDVKDKNVGGGADGKTKSDDKKDGGGTKGDGSMVCRFILTDDGCRRGKNCKFRHEWGSAPGQTKQGRCWECGSNKHMKPDCPTVKTQPKGDGKPPQVKKEVDSNQKPKSAKKASVEDPKPEGDVVVKKEEGNKVVPSTSSSTTPGVEQLMAEGANGDVMALVKSLRPSVKTVRLNALKEMGVGRALLDGGATHVLRSAKSKEEFESAIPTKVELAAGEVTLRQVEGTGTLVTDFDTQTIIPLGKLALMGYQVMWNSDGFTLKDPKGKRLEVELDSGCPTVDEETALKLVLALEEVEMEVERRISALRAGHRLDLNPTVWKWLVDFKKMFPEVPDELAARVIPSGEWDGDCLPWNRRWRRQLQSCEDIILHLFSGPHQSWWSSRLNKRGRLTLCLDKEVSELQDLHHDGVASYLAFLAGEGRVAGVIGGPPCRSVSKLRFRRPGPPPVRARHGPQRFALEGLSEANHELAFGDAVLWMRQLWLYMLAQGARRSKVFFMKENPRDPEEIKQPGDTNDYPSFFAFPEWEAFKEKYNMWEVRVELGAFGHEMRKPTTLGTNLPLLRYLEGKTGGGVGGGSQPVTLDKKIKRSKAWAAWPVKFKEEVVRAIEDELDDPAIRKMSAEQWAQHRANDHMPFSKECPTCQRGAGRSRAHRRVPDPDTYTLSIDLCGPFRGHADQEGGVGKYFMVGVFTIPVSSETKNALVPGFGELMKGEKEEDPKPAIDDEVESLAYSTSIAEDDHVAGEVDEKSGEDKVVVDDLQSDEEDVPAPKEGGGEDEENRKALEEWEARGSKFETSPWSRSFRIEREHRCFMP